MGDATRRDAFGRRLAQARNGEKMSQERLAELVGVSKRAVQRWESGEDRPNIDRLDRIASALQKPSAWFLLPNDRLEQLQQAVGLAVWAESQIPDFEMKDLGMTPWSSEDLDLLNRVQSFAAAIEEDVRQNPQSHPWMRKPEDAADQPAEAARGAPAPPSDTASDEREKQEPVSGPDTQSLLAQLVAAQVQMLQAQARTDARLERIETHMEAMLDELRAEGQEGCCGYGEGYAEGPGQASGDARRSA